MRAPELSRDGDALIWTFSESCVAIGFDLLRETSEGLFGEVSVQGSQEIQPGKSAHYHWAKFNLSSTRSRSDLARTLKERNPDLDWGGLLEYACVHTAESWRRGEPVVDLSLGEEPTAEPYLIDGFLPDGETSVIFADGGQGKSLVALALGLAVRTGRPLPGGLRPTRMGNVLYLDWETSRLAVKKRLHWLANGAGIEPPTILYRPMFRALADDIAAIRQEVTRHAISLVIVDSIGPACGGEPESADIILRLFNAMRSLTPATRLVVSHVSRAGAEMKNGSARPFGSAFVQNMARAVWELRKADDGETSGSLAVALYARKANDDQLHAPIGLDISFDHRAHAITIAGLDVSEDSSLAAHASLSFRVRQSLKRGAQDTKRLAEMLGVPEPTIRKTCQRMNDVCNLNADGASGKLARWGLVAKGKDDDLPF